jgi:secreted trypsin-like serine protease
MFFGYFKWNTQSKKNEFTRDSLGICISDEGGPVFFYDEDSATFTIVGVISWGVLPCGESGYPDFHERVYTHIDWIRNVTNV